MNIINAKVIDNHNNGSLKLRGQIFQLGFDYIANPATNELIKVRGFTMGDSLKIEPKLMEVLICLAEFHNQVVTKEYLIERIWQNYGGAEDALMQAISKLRKYMQDDAKKQNTIKTISKKGYRLILPVRAIDPSALHPEQYPLPAATRSKTDHFTAFIDRLTEPRFFFAFLVFAVFIVMVLGILSYMTFWMAVI